MSILYMSIIALAAGVIGGFINYYLPLNNPETGSDNAKKRPLNPLFKCIILGIGATLLVPLFLELAKSKLLDNLTFNRTSTCTKPKSIGAIKVTLYLDSLKNVLKSDTTVTNLTGFKVTIKKELLSGKILSSDTTLISENVSPGQSIPSEHEVAKNYFLWLSYCVIAASAGFRFINMLISRVVTVAEVSALKDKLKTQTQEKELTEIQNEKNQRVAEERVFEELTDELQVEVEERGVFPIPRRFIIPTLPPGKHANDTQKGRFGGLSANNNRLLSANVEKTAHPEFFKVTFSVEPQNNQPIESDVLFYLDSSFNPSVIKISKAQIDANNGRAEHSLEAWGAFTIGAITDFGTTLLELDLADPEIKAPRKFKER